LRPTKSNRSRVYRMSTVVPPSPPTAPAPRQRSSALLLANVVIAFAAGCSNAESEPAAPAAARPISGALVAPRAATLAPPDMSAATAQVADETPRDPFAGVDTSQSDVLRHIARIDPAVAARAAARPATAARPRDGEVNAGATSRTAPPIVATDTGRDLPSPAPRPTPAPPTAAAVVSPAPAPVVSPVPVLPPVTESPPATALAAATPPAGAAAPAPVAARRALARPAPTFPREALREGHSEGRVVADLRVAADGRVTDVEVLSSTPSRAFGRAAQLALRDWRYEPAVAPSTVQVELVFRTE